MNIIEFKKKILGKSIVAVSAYDTDDSETVGKLKKREVVIKAIKLSDGTKLYFDRNYYQVFVYADKKHDAGNYDFVKE